MKAVRAKYENGQVVLAEAPPVSTGPVEVLVVFPEEDPWQAILDDSTPRPELARWVAEVKHEVKSGRASALSTDSL